MNATKKSLCLIILVMACCVGFSSVGSAVPNYPLTFIDDLGQEITLNAPAERIISLYSAHTENLFSIGLEQEIIGVGRVDIYPPAVFKKPRYDYRSDPEKVIAAEPDLVLIRPFIKRSRPEFVEALQKAGLRVVALYPDSFDEFDEYISLLASITGKQEQAEQLLRAFRRDIEAIRERTEGMTPKVKVYFESVEKGYKTVTPDSTPARAIEAAGGLNIAQDAFPVKKGSSIGRYGIEKLLEHADDIDVYISQRGTMHAGGNAHSISVRPGFYAIKAVQEKRIYVINEKIMSAPTFRHVKGIRELARMFYPSLMDDLSGISALEELSREDTANIVVRFKHAPIFVPTSRYYRKERKGHTYGMFQDVSVTHPAFDNIETAVKAGYMQYDFKDGEERFHPAKTVTRNEFAQILFMLRDFENKREQLEIKDIDAVSHAAIVRILVNNGIMKTKDGYFFPEQPVSGKDALEILGRLK